MPSDLDTAMLTPSDGKETVRCSICDAVILAGSEDVVLDRCEACEDGAIDTIDVPRKAGAR